MTPAPTSLPAYRESVQPLACEGERLLAILAEPEGPPSSELGVIIVVGGPQYRAGSHRQFVHLARVLAAAGICTLRFDVRGMGDSTGAQRSFENLTADTGAAIDALLAARPHLQRVALWGLCDGASAALLYLHEREDPRVAALCLLNPWVRSEASLARTHVKHYYLQRLMQPSFWRKLVRGGVGLNAARSLGDNLVAAGRTTGPSGERPAYQTRMSAAWSAFAGPILLVLSGNDYTAREFETYAAAYPEWRGLLSRPNVSSLALDGADHTLSETSARRALEASVVHWLNGVQAHAVTA